MCPSALFFRSTREVLIQVGIQSSSSPRANDMVALSFPHLPPGGEYASKDLKHLVPWWHLFSSTSLLLTAPEVCMCSVRETDPQIQRDRLRRKETERQTHGWRHTETEMLKRRLTMTVFIPHKTGMQPLFPLNPTRHAFFQNNKCTCSIFVGSCTAAY